MTREEAIKILKEIIDTGWLISDIDKCTAIDACEMAIEALEQEPCEDCISRQAVLDMIENAQIITDGEFCGYCTEDIDINILPPVAPQQKMGKWVKTPKAVMGEGYMWYCDKCEYQVYQDNSRPYPSEKFCPNCGQPKMQEVEE